MESNKINKDTKIGVLCGGMSAERDVSLRSGKNVLQALLRLGYKNSVLVDADKDVAQKLKDEKIEVAYNTLHGRYGEDGCIQGLLEIMGIKYTGCDVKSSAICMDKETTKNVLSANGLSIIKSVCVNKGEDYKAKASKLNYPLMIKPAKEGSSIGMSKVNNENELDCAMELAYKSDSKVLIEEYLQGYSCTVGVLDDGKEPFATPILGFKTKTEWYDYEAKYTEGLTTFELPASLSEKLTEEIQKMSVKAHIACGCQGVSRVDFLVYNDIPYILEINTNPGMTDLSDLPAQAKYMGMGYDKLVEFILNTSMIKK